MKRAALISIRNFEGTDSFAPARDPAAAAPDGRTSAGVATEFDRFAQRATFVSVLLLPLDETSEWWGSVISGHHWWCRQEREKTYTHSWQQLQHCRGFRAAVSVVKTCHPEADQQ